MTIKMLMEIPVLNNVRVIAGKKYLDQEVVWCETYETLKKKGCYIPDMLLICEACNQHEIYTIAEFLQDSGFKGLLLTGSKHYCNIVEITDLFDSLQFPVLYVEEDYSSNFLAKQLQNSFIKISMHTIFKEEWLKQICTARLDKLGNTMEEQARYFGYCPSSSYVCLVISNENSIQPLQEFFSKLNKWKRVLCNIFSSSGEEIFDFSTDKEWTYFFKISQKDSVLPVKKKLQEAVRTLMDKEDTADFICAIGTVAKTIKDFPISYQNAKKAAYLNRVLELPKVLALYDDFYMFFWLLKAPEEELNEFVNKTLGMLVTPENQYLFNSLKSFLDSHTHLAPAAKTLGCHPNTLKYRLEKIEQLTGHSYTDLGSLYQFRMAIYILNYLKNKEKFEEKNYDNL